MSTLVLDLDDIRDRSEEMFTPTCPPSTLCPIPHPAYASNAYLYKCKCNKI